MKLFQYIIPIALIIAAYPHPVLAQQTNSANQPTNMTTELITSLRKRVYETMLALDGKPASEVLAAVRSYLQAYQPALVATIAEKDPATLAQAVYLLGFTESNTAAIDSLLTTTVSDSLPIRGAAFQALNNMGASSDEFKDRVTQTLAKTNDASLIIQASSAAGRLKLNAAIPSLIQQFRSNSSMLARVAAVRALGDIGPAANAVLKELRFASEQLKRDVAEFDAAIEKIANP